MVQFRLVYLYQQLPNVSHSCLAVVQVRDVSKIQVVVTAQSLSALWNIRMAQINCSSVQRPGNCISHEMAMSINVCENTAESEENVIKELVNFLTMESEA